MTSVEKSYVDGAWKAAKDLTRSERLTIRVLKPKPKPGMTTEDKYAAQAAKLVFNTTRSDAAETNYATKVRGRTVHLRVMHPSEHPNMLGVHMVAPTPGKGQRDALHLVKYRMDGDEEATLRHELGHANVRKPMSAFMRRARAGNRARWSEEARADSHLTDPRDSPYADIARTGDKPYGFHLGFKPADMRRYRAVSDKIAAAKGNTNRKPIVVRRKSAGETLTMSDDRQLKRTFAMPRGRRTFAVDSKGEAVAKGAFTTWRLTPRYIKRAQGKAFGRRLQMRLRGKTPPPRTPAPSAGKRLLQRRDVQAGLVAAPVIGAVGGTIGYKKAKQRQQEQYEEPLVKSFSGFALVPLTPQLEPVDKGLHRHARKVLKEITTNGASYQYSRSKKRRVAKRFTLHPVKAARAAEQAERLALDAKLWPKAVKPKKAKK